MVDKLAETLSRRRDQVAGVQNALRERLVKRFKPGPQNEASRAEIVEKNLVKDLFRCANIGAKNKPAADLVRALLTGNATPAALIAVRSARRKSRHLRSVRFCSWAL
jgi:hypothetical protein